jgi:hypothetical protein
MKTPKEKAEELVSKFKIYADDNYADDTNPYYGQILANKRIVLHNSAKQCALIAVDEILNNFLSNRTTEYGRERYHFWQEVKQEIEKL